MTHTFKLARRMARFRVLAAALAFQLGAACGDGENLPSTAPTLPPAADTDSTRLDSAPSTGPQQPAGIPFGPFGAWERTDLKAGMEHFTASIGAVDASNILSLIEMARSQGIRLVLAMTGGSHDLYLTRGAFDEAKWRARMDEYDTPEIRAAVAQAVADGTIIGNFVMDEPQVHGLGDGNTWGPPGTMTKQRVDALCGYVKSRFPTLPVGVAHGPHLFEPEESYHQCDFLLAQYTWRVTGGDVVKFRDTALALGRRDGLAIIFSLNILNGGVQAPRGTWNCSPLTTGGRGTSSPNCRMTAPQLRDWGKILGVAGCALVMWRYDEVFMSHPGNLQAFRDIGAALAAVPARSCSGP